MSPEARAVSLAGSQAGIVTDESHGVTLGPGAAPRTRRHQPDPARPLSPRTPAHEERNHP